MIVRSTIIVILVSLVSRCSGDCISSRHEFTEKQEMEEVVGLLLGNFTSQWQAETSVGIPNIQTHVVPIWCSAQRGSWLYVEQYLNGQYSRPFRQRVYHLKRVDGLIRHRSFKLEDEKLHVGAWTNPSEFSLAESLLEFPGCDMFFSRVDAVTFKSSTRPFTCKARTLGADYVIVYNTITPYRILQERSGWYMNGTLAWKDKKASEHVRIASEL